MIIQVLHCPHCHGTDIVRHGKSPEGMQRYRCRECREDGGARFCWTIPTPGNHLM
jgi:hypothetical protein